MDLPSSSEKESSPSVNDQNQCSGEEEELDPELDALLDDSLAGFSTYSAPKPSNSEEQATAGSLGDKSAFAGSEEEDVLRTLLGGAMSDGAAGEFEEHLKSILQDDPLAMAEFEKLSSAMPDPPANAESQKNFADTLAETLSSLSANAESLKSDMSEDDLLKSFQESLNLGGGGSGAGDGDFIPMMQGMMSSLLSKEILYPSLKDLADKYPGWLSANNGKLPKNQFDNYVRQFDIVSKLCDCYDSEKDTDTQQEKDGRFEKLLDLMTEMQECGPPPKEIVGELAPGLNFDNAGNPQLPGMEQCSIM